MPATSQTQKFDCAEKQKPETKIINLLHLMEPFLHTLMVLSGKVWSTQSSHGKTKIMLSHKKNLTMEEKQTPKT